MKIILAPDSFKECMSAGKAAQVMKEAIHKVDPTIEVRLLPVADGGEGTLEVLVDATDGAIYEKTVTDPLGRPVKASYAILGDGKTAVVEMAQASGLHLVAPQERNPLQTTTFGTGELIKAALDRDVTEIVVTVGGSATNDAGSGLLQALGVVITDKNGVNIGFGGGALSEVQQIDFSNMDPRLEKVKLSIAADVTNPLIGEKGASHVFGPQKGATPEMVALLDANLAHFAEVVRRDAGKDITAVPGAGAAGGTAGALMLLGGSITPGIDMVLDILHFNEQIQDADYVFTGEGKIDKQTPDGKVIAGISKLSKKANVPVIAFAGSVSPGFEALYKDGLLSVHSITPGPCTLEEALENGDENLRLTVENVVRLIT